jgi:TolB-like protein/Tfp pilus assembly protein PilF
MKRCPICRRDYTDETLNFCLDDGARLVDGPTLSDLPTVMYTTMDGPFGSPTQSAEARETATSANSIAVLPFLNLSGEDFDYFTDGLAEELLNVLAKIRGIRVAARTSAFSFKGRSATVSEIGRALNVTTVLEGSIRKAGEHIRISVQLVKVFDGYQLWSETYNRQMDDIFAIQDDIAKSVVEEIRVRLLGETPGADISRQVNSEIANAVRGRSLDSEAQRLLMLGRYFLDRTTREDTAKAIEYFREALEIDPEFALCWAELGRAYSIEAGRGWINAGDGYKSSREAALRALSIEPDLAEGHAQLGRVKAAHDWDLSGAEDSYRRALELAPGSSPVLDGASVLYYKLGKLDEALQLARRVLEQDPLSAPYWHNFGLISHAAGHLADAEKGFRRALEIAPQRLVTRALLSIVLLENGNTSDAEAEANRETDDVWRTWARAMVWFAIDRKAEADAALQELVERFAAGNAYQVAEVYAFRGDTDEAFLWLERALDERDPGITHAKVNPRFRSLYTDPRWLGLLSKAGIMHMGDRSEA